MTTRPASVFVVDNDRSVRNSLDRLLSRSGYRTETFASAPEFVEHARIDSPACLLVDVNMPEYTGFDLFDRLRAAGRNLPVIFMTAGEDTSMVARAVAVGAASSLTKPIDERALVDAVEQVIAQSANSQILPVGTDRLQQRSRSVSGPIGFDES